MVGLAVLCGVALAGFASLACPGPTATDACRGAGLNRAVVIGLASASVVLLAAPVAFLAE